MKWRNAKQIKGHRANLVGFINANRDGSMVEIDYSTAKALVEILDQAIHTEEGQEKCVA